MKIEQYQCKSYYDDDHKLQDCECGKCGKKDIEQEIMEMFRDEISFLIANKINEDISVNSIGATTDSIMDKVIPRIITLVQKREREEMVESIIKHRDSLFPNGTIHNGIEEGKCYAYFEIIKLIETK